MKYIIQIGAGKGNDHVNDLIKNNKSEYFGVFVEPNPFIFKNLTESYSFSEQPYIFENLAISTNTGEVIIYFNDIDGVLSDSAHSSMNLYHVLRHGNPPERITPKTIPCITFEELLKKHKLETVEIEYLFIDTEGHDCDIIQSIDFKKYNIKNICFERLHTDGPFKQGEKFDKTKEYLTQFGYLYKGISPMSDFDVLFTKG